jgi:hypothetical protein
MSLVLADCAGLWRRSLLIGADGTRDAGGDVRWLQGSTAYVDSRGFAGRLQCEGDVFHWHRDVDLDPPGPFPDAGVMHWDGDVLVETGVHEDYVEHWVRDGHATEPTGAAYLRSGDGSIGLLLRVGNWYGWAGGGTVAVGAVGQWLELGIALSDSAVQYQGACWTIERSEGDLGP